MPGVLILDELQSATEGGGIKLAAPLQTQDGADLLSPTGQVSVNFDNVANNSISGDKIHGGTISGLNSLEISGENPIINLTDTGTNVTHKINADSSIGQLILYTDYNSNGSDSRFSVRVGGESEKLQIGNMSTKIYHGNSEFRFEEHSTSENAEIKVVSGSGKASSLYFGDVDDGVRAGIVMNSITNELSINGYNNTPRFYITPSGLINARTNSTIQGKYIYSDNSAGIDEEVNILAPDGVTPLRSTVSTNTTFMVMVQTTGTATVGAYCIYAGDMRNNGSQGTNLYHIAGNSVASSNKPYMGVNSSTQNLYWTMNHASIYPMRITVILNGGISGKSY